MPQVRANDKTRKRFRVRVIAKLFNMQDDEVRKFQAGQTIEVNDQQFAQMTSRGFIIQDIVPDNTASAAPSASSETAKPESDSAKDKPSGPPPRRDKKK